MTWLTVAIALSTIASAGLGGLDQAHPSQGLGKHGEGDRIAQTDLEVRSTIDLSRAKNLARQAAERANGGISQYRAEDSMHGPATESPYEVNPDGSWTFTFLGGVPGSDNYTIESEVTVTPTRTVTIDYNGPIRD